MSKRLIILFALILLPLTSQAATEPAAGLGPATTNDTGSSNAASSALQPAGNTPIQSSTSDGTGLTAPTSNALQAPTTPNETLQVIMNDGDGRSHEPVADDNGVNWGWLWWSLGLALVIAGGFIVMRDRRRFRHH